MNPFHYGFESEDELDCWSVSGGVWELGVPTSGPSTNALGSRAFKGDRCAATVLAGNYADNTSGRLESCAFLVPSAQQQPRLRFWHWFHFSAADWGRVEIKVGAGDWEPLPDATFSSTSGNVWSRPSIDLSAYAGRLVRIGFYFQSSTTCCPTTSHVGPGWYLDEVAVVTGAPVSNNPENFESGLGDWSADHGTWEVGIPTFGPPVNPDGKRAFQGDRVAGTVLGGNYQDNTAGRLVSPTFVVPDASANPRLRFWHWFAFSTADSGRVQIRIPGGDWQTLPEATYASVSSGVWTRPSLSLRAYAGLPVQIAFHFQSATTCCPTTSHVAPGWYLDEVTIETGAPALANPETFESGLGDWSADHGTWQVGAPSSGPGGAYEGGQCAATVLSGNYADNTSGRLISPAFEVPPARTNPRLRFWHWYQFSTADSGRVQIRVDGGEWQDLPDAVYASNSSGVWARPSLPLAAYAGQTVQIGFLFQSSTTCCPTTTHIAAGWYIDEVRLLHDFALMIDAVTVRSGTSACVPVRVAASVPVSTVQFAMGWAEGDLQNPTVSTEQCWAGSATMESGGTLTVHLETGCETVPMGVRTVGYLCFDAMSTTSRFSPLNPGPLTVVNADGSRPRSTRMGGRVAIIADRPLLESWVEAGRRMAGLHGIGGKTYGVQYTTNLSEPDPWTPGWVQTVPAEMFTAFPITGSLSNAPALFLYAEEQ